MWQGLLESKPVPLRLTTVLVVQLDDEWYIAFVNEVGRCASSMHSSYNACGLAA